MSDAVSKTSNTRFWTWAELKLVCARTDGAMPGAASTMKAHRQARTLPGFISYLSRPFKAISLRTIVTFEFILQFCERLFNRIDEICATGNQRAHRLHRIALSKIIRHHQHLAVRL